MYLTNLWALPWWAQKHRWPWKTLIHEAWKLSSALSPADTPAPVFEGHPATRLPEQIQSPVSHLSFLSTLGSSLTLFPFPSPFEVPQGLAVFNRVQLSEVAQSFPTLGDLPDPGIKPRSPALQADALPSEHSFPGYKNLTEKYQMCLQDSSSRS